MGKARRQLRLVAVVLALAMVAVACGDDEDEEGTAGGGGQQTRPQTVAVQVDGKTDDFAGAFIGYFPNEVTVHPGDTVEFNSIFTGEPHTVTLGTLVDTGVAEAQAAGEEAEEEPAALQKIPVMLPEGPGDAIQASSQPCYLASGDPPANDACTDEQQRQPDFTGTQTYYNSGFLSDGETFRVKLADNINPGTYQFFCALHRMGMTGKITVVGRDAEAQTPEEVAAEQRRQFDEVVGKLKPSADALRTGTFPPFVPTARPGTVVAGSGVEDVEALVAEFGPKEVSVPAGDSVTWLIVGPHTISFGASEELRTFISKAPDGSVHLNERSLAPAGGPGQTPPEEGEGGPPPEPPPGTPPPEPKITDGGTWDGTGFRSSGIFFSGPPALEGYRLTFTRAGTYEYACLVHPDMTGTVKVG